MSSRMDAEGLPLVPLLMERVGTPGMWKYIQELEQRIHQLEADKRALAEEVQRLLLYPPQRIEAGPDINASNPTGVATTTVYPPHAGRDG